MIRVRRKGHARRGYVKDVKPGVGVKIRRIKPAYVDGATFLARDRGKRGRTPKADQWYPKGEGAELGWRKAQPIYLRRQKLLVAARKLGARNAWYKIHGLANVTADKETKKLARADAAWLSARFKKK